MESQKFRSRLWLFIRYFLLSVITVISLFPVFYMIATSLKQPIQVYDPGLWIFKPTFENYISLFRAYNIGQHLLNSVIVTFVSVTLSLFLGSLTAYGIMRFNFKRKKSLEAWILSIRFLPPIAGIIPFFLIGSFLNILDTYLLLIIGYLTFNIPFAIWMLRGFFSDIPKEIEEAAFMDGANHWQSLTKVILPLAKPGLFATAALLTIMTWNEFAFALFLTTKNRTLPPITAQFQTVRGVMWGEMTALGLLTILPVIFFAIVARKYLVRGLTFGAIK